MAYHGEHLNACGLIEIDLSELYVVAVSGDGPNICGHLLLYTPRRGGFYFHVADLVGNPYYMTQNGYRRYLKESKKRELKRIKVPLREPRQAEAYLEGLLAGSWVWGVLPHNCVAFCEAVIAEGGGEWGSFSNCPAIATDVPQDAIYRFINGLESEIRRAYGVPY